MISPRRSQIIERRLTLRGESLLEYKLIQVLILIISYVLLILIKQFIKVSRISRSIIRFSLFLIFLKEVVSYIYRYQMIERTLLEKRLYEAFDVFDIARSGQVDVRDLGTIIRALGCVVTEAELQEIQVEVEDVENNSVPINRFVEYMSKAISEGKFKPAEPEELLKAFQLLDPENRGYVMKDDLEKSIMEIGEPFTKEEVADMMAAACDAETGKINYEHYINLLIVKIPEDINVYNIVDIMEAERLAALPNKKRLVETLLKEDT